MIKEFILAFAEIDENVSHYIDDNIRQYTLEPARLATRNGRR